MTNCYMSFTYPWLLLLLIPAFALALIPYFRLSKRYRRNRNRITSIVLYCTIMTLAITLLAGLTFRYQVPNSENEIILLVDYSETEEQAADNRDDFVGTVLDYCRNNNFRVGIVTFGLDQKYVAPFNDDVDEVYDQYLSAEAPDVSATDIASALEYAKDLFTYRETSKIVLVTDGKETDRRATDVVRAIEAQGTRVDVALIPSEYDNDDVQILDITLPDYHVSLNEQFNIEVTVYSNSQYDNTTIQLFDNDVLVQSATLDGQVIVPGEQQFTMTHSFATGDLHSLKVVVDPNRSDLLDVNNEYVTHYNMEIFNKLLILESTGGQSQPLSDLINNENEYEITVLDVYNDTLPATVNELREYDQIILNNISNADLTDLSENPNLPKEERNGVEVSVMVENLNEYVEDHGGALFTVGGSNTDGTAHAYNVADMQGTLYQQMLPVLATNYVPPIGLMVIIDRSGSMGGEKLEAARTGAASCLDALAELGDEHYFGLMTLDSGGAEAVVLDPTPVTRKEQIQDAISSIDTTGGGTVFPGAIRRAAQTLSLLESVDKRHIIVVTDGQVSDDQVPVICDMVSGYHESINLTISIVAITVGSSGNTGAMANMQAVVDAGKNEDGTGGGELHVITDLKDFVREMREDIDSGHIIEVNQKPFTPTIKNLMSPIFIGIERGEGSANTHMTVEVGGFYGTKRRADAELLLAGEYDVPLYAQWEYGYGKVGSFMCDLQNSDWSSQFMADANGRRLIKNIINNLMPVENIKSTLLDMRLREDNITNSLTVTADLQQGQRVTGEIVNVETQQSVSLNSLSGSPADSDVYIMTALNADNNYTRCYFGVKTPGVYAITARIVDENGNVVENSEKTIYKSFAYSQEYNLEQDTQEDIAANMQNVAQYGGGSFIEDLNDPYEVIENFKIVFDREFDPKYLFLILIIVLFLLEIAVRKFKFKWPHELIREYREKKNNKQ